MKKWLRGGLRFLFVTIGIIVLTSFGIDATDSFRSSQTALGILTQDLVGSQVCPEGMVEVTMNAQSYCVDQFENSVGEQCPIDTPRSSQDSQTNIIAPNCTSASVANVQPWTHVTYHQAKTACARRGGNVLDNNLWYEAAIGTPDDDRACVVDSNQVQLTGSRESCTSAYAVHDMIGNVWEWVDAEVTNGRYEDRPLPEEGFVAAVDTNGVATMTTTTGQFIHGNDYFWSEADGTYAMMRGGFHNSRSDGGIFSVHAKIAPSFSSAAIGFRCVIRQS